MLELVKGHKVSQQEKLSEGYTQTSDKYWMANVDAKNILDVFQHFIVLHEEPLFFILELPVDADREKPLAPYILRETHSDVYYIDGCSREECLTLLIRYGDLLINDGMSKSGFGGHDSQDEIMLDKYNLMHLYSLHLDELHDFFELHDINYVEQLVTAWDTFTPESPGISVLYEVAGKTVYDLPEELADWGIYRAETKVDY